MKRIYEVKYDSVDFIDDQRVWVQAATLKTAISKAQRHLKVNAAGFRTVTAVKLLGTIDVE